MENRHWVKSLALFVHLSSELIFWSLLGVGLGYWVSSRYGDVPWIVALGAIVGLGVGMGRLIKTSLKENEKENSK
ncbi:MAG: hypothetical protein CL678_12610 [Bdellovibrionaceae bacterium]|nr:hypothetical protein [Pseudobdellovibrionaceae bacterium]|tara:strand:+ start:8619 stop:8843 length:225 start_codon:yes stop_codon:yes gene_type:complete